jgi:TorA maturation chaperone TorD
MSSGDDLQERRPLSEEDAGRANLYALIGRLFYDAPDSILLGQLCREDAESTGNNAPLARPSGALSTGNNAPLGRAWRSLRDACGSAYPEAVKREHESLFVGVGKSEVTPYTSHYVVGNSPDRHLVRLRERLDELGLARRSATFEVEDHVSGICDVMRILIEGGHPLSEQSLFFKEFVYSGVTPFCAAVAVATSAALYRCVAEFTRAFLEVERQAFEMHEAEA